MKSIHYFGISIVLILFGGILYSGSHEKYFLIITLIGFVFYIISIIRVKKDF